MRNTLSAEAGISDPSRPGEGDQRATCGPCHPDADCYNSVVAQRPGHLLADVAVYQNPEVVLRIAEKLTCDPDKAQSIFNQMKQYLAEAALSSTDSAKQPTKDVDAAWHEFILFTKDYAVFCRVHFGFFIHHVPTPRLTRDTGSVN
jgi:hypothetical protein